MNLYDKLFQFRPIPGLLLAGFVVLIVGYSFLDLYHVRLGREIVNNWLESEIISIQQGNLLSSVSKTQRLIMSSDILKGVFLVSTSEYQDEALIQIGQPLKYRLRITPDIGDVHVSRVGIAEYVFSVAVPNRADHVLNFYMRPGTFLYIFLIFIAIYLLFLISFSCILIKQGKREAREREKLLITGISNFMHSECPNEAVLEEAPTIVSKWDHLKQELNNLIEKQTILVANAKVGEMAARVAHDLRSPVSYLNALVSSATDLDDRTRVLLKSCSDRIEGIANEVLSDFNSSKFTGTRINLDAAVTSQATDGRSTKLEPQIFEPFDLVALVTQEVDAKRAEHSSKNKVRLIFYPPEQSVLISSTVNQLELSRALSNLLNNSFEAIEQDGLITVTIDYDKDNIFVEVRDTGKGIPVDVLKELGQKTITFGKANGHGIGVKSAKDFLNKIGGELRFYSQPSRGTTATMRLPRQSCSLELLS